MRLYESSPETRHAAYALLVRCLWLYTEACAQGLEWAAAIDAGLALAQRRQRRRMRLTADEAELLAFGRAELAKWQHREIQALRLLASAEDGFRWAFREATPFSNDVEIAA